MPIKKQRHCRARTKKKIKFLRLKSFFNRVIENRAEKIAKARRKQLNKGLTITGEAKKYAVKVEAREHSSIMDNRHAMKLNQRQKRKRIRQRNGY